MKILLHLCGIILVCLSLRGAQAVKCYRCGYIEGTADWDLTQDCVNHVNSERVQYEEGVACIKAMGRSMGRSFVVRLPFHPGREHGGKPIPLGQRSMPCDAANVAVTRVGDYKVDSLDSCHVCNDRDACNGVTRAVSVITFNLVMVVTTLILSLSI